MVHIIEGMFSKTFLLFFFYLKALCTQTRENTFLRATKDKTNMTINSFIVRLQLSGTKERKGSKRGDYGDEGYRRGYWGCLVRNQRRPRYFERHHSLVQLVILKGKDKKY